jgi:hypothetical protein
MQQIRVLYANLFIHILHRMIAVARKRRIDIVTNPAFDSLLVEAQWRALKRGMPVCSRTQLIELGVAVLAALEQHLETCQYQPFLPPEVIHGIERNWAALRGSKLAYQIDPEIAEVKVGER